MTDRLSFVRDRRSFFGNRDTIGDLHLRKIAKFGDRDLAIADRQILSFVLWMPRLNDCVQALVVLKWTKYFKNAAVSFLFFFVYSILHTTSKRQLFVSCFMIFPKVKDRPKDRRSWSNDQDHDRRSLLKWRSGSRSRSQFWLSGSCLA